MCSSDLRIGDNVLAVEVHQASFMSPDLTFATELDLLLPAPVTRLKITVSPDGTQATLTWNGAGHLEMAGNPANPNGWQEIANATSPYGPISLSGTRFFRVRGP